MDESKESVGSSRRLPSFRLNNPSVQIVITSACLFLNPGFYLAITLLGAGGGRPSSTVMSNISNGVLYGVFCFAAVGAGSLLNLVGPRLTLLFGITGYPVYQGAMWYYSVYGELWYPVLAGAYLGLCAACLWTAALYTATAYPEEKEKGRWRGIQAAANVSGSAVAAAVALGISWNTTSDGVTPTVYVIFIVLQCCSLGLALLVLPPERLKRSDGTALAVFRDISRKECLQITAKLFKDWRILLLLPCMFAPEVYFPFAASMNAYVFNLRTRILNTLLSNFIQIPANLALGYLLDNERFGTRRKRAFLGITTVAVWVTGANIAYTVWLNAWNFDRLKPGPAIDCTDSAYAGAAVVYIIYTAQYGIFQNIVLYVLGTLTNEPRRTAATGGLFVGVLSAGAAVSFGVDATVQPYMNELAAWFALSVLCWPILYFITWRCTTNTNYFLEADVIAPMHMRQDSVGGGATSQRASSTTLTTATASTIDEKACSISEQTTEA